MKSEVAAALAGAWCVVVGGGFSASAPRLSLAIDGLRSVDAHGHDTVSVSALTLLLAPWLGNSLHLGAWLELGG